MTKKILLFVKINSVADFSYKMIFWCLNEFNDSNNSQTKNLLRNHEINLVINEISTQFFLYYGGTKFVSTAFHTLYVNANFESQCFLPLGGAS